MQRNIDNLQHTPQKRLRTIQQHRSQNQQTIDRYQATSPLEILNKRHNNKSKKQTQSLSRQIDITNKRYSIEQNQQTIVKRNSYDRHRRNKTQVDKKLNNCKNPVYTCLFVPFLQSKGFQQPKKSLSVKYKMGDQDSQNKLANTKSTLKIDTLKREYLTSKRGSLTQKSLSLASKNQKSHKKQLSIKKQQRTTKQINSKKQLSSSKKVSSNHKKAIALPIISKKISLAQNQQNKSAITMNKTNKQSSSRTFSNENIKINEHSFETQIQQQNKTPSGKKQSLWVKINHQQKQRQKNIKDFKLKNRINNSKASKKAEQWKQINFLRLRTCYHHILQKINMNYMNSLMEEKTIQSSTINLASQFNQNQKKNMETLLYQRIIKIPKFPNSIDEVSILIKNYKSLRRKKTSINQLVRSRNFSVKFIENNSLYFGEFNQQIYHGYGVFIKHDYLFEGQWNQGIKLSGLQAKKSFFYEGQFHQNKKDGFGISFWNNGFDEYSGQWKNGLKHGNGVWKNIKGDQYIGQWINGKVQGYGVHSTSDGQKYQGFFVNFLKQGKGKQVFPNGDSYEGQYSEGKPQGLGVYKFKKIQAKYQGQFNKGLRQGKGTLFVEGFFIYSGEFKADKIQGYGKIEYQNNDSYLGNFKDGIRHGSGSFHKFKQKKILNGIWKNGQFFQEYGFKTQQKK